MLCFGDFSTALFLAEVGDITRFNERKEYISFIRIDSATSQSEVASYHRPISKSGSKCAKTILFNVVTTIIQISTHTDKEIQFICFSEKNNLKVNIITSV